MYLFTSKYIKNSKSLFEGNVIGYKVPYERSFDIDSIEDKNLVSYLYSRLNMELGEIYL